MGENKSSAHGISKMAGIVSRVEFCDIITNKTFNFILSPAVSDEELLRLCSRMFGKVVAGFISGEGVLVPADLLLSKLPLFDGSSMFVFCNEDHSRYDFSRPLSAEEDSPETIQHTQDDNVPTDYIGPEFEVQNVQISVRVDDDGSEYVFLVLNLIINGSSKTVSFPYDLVRDTPSSVILEMVNDFAIPASLSESLLIRLEQALDDFVPSLLRCYVQQTAADVLAEAEIDELHQRHTAETGDYLEAEPCDNEVMDEFDDAFGDEYLGEEDELNGETYGSLHPMLEKSTEESERFKNAFDDDSVDVEAFLAENYDDYEDVVAAPMSLSDEERCDFARYAADSSEDEEWPESRRPPLSHFVSAAARPDDDFGTAVEVSAMNDDDADDVDAEEAIDNFSDGGAEASADLYGSCDDDLDERGQCVVRYRVSTKGDQSPESDTAGYDIETRNADGSLRSVCRLPGALSRFSSTADSSNNLQLELASSSAIHTTRAAQPSPPTHTVETMLMQVPQNTSVASFLKVTSLTPSPSPAPQPHSVGKIGLRQPSPASEFQHRTFLVPTGDQSQTAGMEIVAEDDDSDTTGKAISKLSFEEQRAIAMSELDSSR